MFLKKLHLSQFKNHKQSLFNFKEQITCFTGNNGAGKTNILDAIHYLSQTKSYFNYKDAQNINFKDKYFMIKGIFSSGNQENEIQCNFSLEKGKSIHHDKIKYKRFSNHFGKFPVIIISPTDNNLIIEGSEIRRKYLDTCIAQYKPNYLTTLIKYNKILKQRNKLLKQFSEKNYFDQITIDSYDEKMIEFGQFIYNSRVEFLKELQPVFNKYYHNISGGNENVNINFISQLKDNSYLALLKKSINQDRVSRYTQKGIHKDDMIFEMDNHPIKKIGSQGQQKSFLISLKLAQFEFIKEKKGFKPILLLDDIFDKLDDNRVLKLMELVNQKVFGQVFITDTHKDRTKTILKRAKLNYHIFSINEGQVINEEN